VNGNTRYSVSNTALLSIAAEEAPVVITSAEIDEAMAETLVRLRIRPGLVERVTGVRERRWWAEGTPLAEGAAMAGAKAMSEAGVDPSAIGLLINTSVSREHLEPAVSVEVHDRLGLSTSAMNFDVTNACLGFVNGLQVASSMIDSGQVDYALIVGSEDVRQAQQETIRRLSAPDSTRADYLDEFATFTLGSGSAAAVLGRADAHPEGHRILGGVTRAGTQHHGLCRATMGRMVTDARGLMDAGVGLIADAWEDAKQDWNWATGIARYVLHQVSVPHTQALLQRLALDGMEKVRVPLTFPLLGNVGPAALPITLARQVDSLLPGDRVLCMGVGSGLNTALCEIRW
jgi:3-oxoacyl-[acyl-carrier-protein] synthase-3